MAETLITAEALMALRESNEHIALLDVRWRLDRPDGTEAFATGHIPGAVYVSLEADLSVHGEPTDGRHPLPGTARLQEVARAWGLREGQRVVAYDDTGGMSAARAWWVLRDAGLDVSILDGGLSAWVAAGGALESGAPQPEPGDVVLSSGHMPRLSIDEVAALPDRVGGVLLDARAPERYRGETEPMDPKAGHIPGARNAPTSENIDASGRFLSADALRRRFADLGLEEGDKIGVYCGSGVTAAHEIAALEHAGFSAALYPGSWSQWSNTADRPVETGDGKP